MVVEGSLESDGATTLDGAEVTGSVIAMSGTLSIPSLAPATLRDLTLTSRKWIAGPGAPLDLPAVTTNDAELTLDRSGRLLRWPHGRCRQRTERQSSIWVTVQT